MSKAPPPAVLRTLSFMKSHPAVVEIRESSTTVAGTFVTVDMHVAMRPKGIKAGVSSTGVKVIEPTTWGFPADFPMRSPRITVRLDFDRSLAHVQPGAKDGPPEPCILYGSLDELLQQRGIDGIVDQLADWLSKAAEGTLIDPKQGWEPVRRDVLTDTVVADLATFESLIARAAGKAFFHIRYARSHQGHTTTGLLASLVMQVPATQVNAQRINDQLREQAVEEGFACGNSLAALVWPAASHCAATYLPETVYTLGELRKRAEVYGCAKPLEKTIKHFQITLKSYNGPAIPVLIIVCARRPYSLIGSIPPSKIEYCMYRIDAHPGQATFPKGNATQVCPAAHRDVLSETLARRISGTAPPKRKWTLIGAGSLGSKLAVHLTRAGLSPRTIIDRATLHTHNFVRHALLPDPRHTLFEFHQEKAERLQEMITTFGATAAAMSHDVRTVLGDDAAVTAAFASSSIIVNGTASLVVREVLSRTHPALLQSRVCEAALYDSARMGLLTVEGNKRNPNTGYLIGEVYQRLSDHLMRAPFFATTTTDAAIGQGCSSTTSIASDTLISRHAAPMTEALTRLLTDDLQESGWIAVGYVDGMSTIWETHDVRPCTLVTPDERPDWTVHLGARAEEKITEDVGQWPNVETGGVLIGRYSETAQGFYITDVLIAPPDSVRSADEFILGTKGLTLRLDMLMRKTNGSLYCLGTWHSHLVPSGPSGTDQATARAIALAQVTPAVLLIHTPIGYRALVATQIAT